MGKIYTFWSPLHGQCKTTSTAIAVAMAEAKKGIDTVITHVQPRLSFMEKYLGFDEQQNVLKDVGLNYLIYNEVARELNEKDIKQAVIKICEHLYMLPAIEQAQCNAEKDLLISNLVVNELPKYYRRVIIDLGTETYRGNLRGSDRELIKTITDAAATNFVVLSQSTWLWEKYETPNSAYIISGYDPMSRNTKFTFKFKTGESAITIPLCTAFSDALSSGEVPLFYERNENLNIKKPQENISLFLKQTSEVIKNND